MQGRWLTLGISAVIGGLGVWACSSDDTTPATTGRDAGTGTVEEDSATPPDPSLDAGGDPPGTVTITYGACPAFTPCGGDPTGKWKVSGGCVSSEALAALKTGACSGVQESNVVIKASGTVDVNATTVARKTTVDLSGKLAIPPGCAAQAGGNCNLVGIFITTSLQPGQPPPFDSATCTKDNTTMGCNCDVAKKISEDTSDTYTVTGNTLVTANPPRRFDFCVQGNKNTYRENMDGGVPVTLEITK